MERLAKAHLLVTRFPFEAQWGGEEVHTLSLMQALDKRGHEVHFMGSCPMLLPAFQQGKFPVKKTRLGKPPVSKGWLIAFTLLSPLLFLKAGWQLSRARKQWKIDTVYMLSFGEKLLMTPWARLFKMKVLWLEHARIGRWLTKNPWRHVYKRWSRWATVVVTSHAMVKHLAPWVDKVEAIPCAVMAPKAGTLPTEIQDFIKGHFAVATVSRLTLDKGVDMMVRLVHNKPDMRLIIVGDGPLRGTVESALSSGQILWLKSLPREQLMRLYAELDLFVLASREMDPFGMVAAEAMWHGAPTLVTSVCGISEDLHPGREALVVPPRFSALDKAVKQIMKQPSLKGQLSRQGQEFAKKHYNFPTMVQAFEALL